MVAAHAVVQMGDSGRIHTLFLQKCQIRLIRGDGFFAMRTNNPHQPLRHN